jgi:hypothetical protein
MIGTPRDVRKLSEVAVCKVRVRGEVTMREILGASKCDFKAAERAAHWVSRPKDVRGGSWTVKSRM